MQISITLKSFMLTIFTENDKYTYAAIKRSCTHQLLQLAKNY